MESGVDRLVLVTGIRRGGGGGEKGGGGVRLFSCMHDVAPRRERRACGPLVPVREMLLMSPQAVAAVAAAEAVSTLRSLLKLAN